MDKMFNVPPMKGRNSRFVLDDVGYFILNSYFVAVVMEGWNIAIPTMKMGESCQIFVTSKYAFDDGNSCIIDLELVDFYGMFIIYHSDSHLTF